MKRYVLILSLFLPLACDDFLDPYPSAIRSEEYIWTNQSTVQGLIGQCYDWVAANYNDNEGAYLDGAADNAVRTSSTDIINRFAAGTISPTEDPFQTYWTRDYRGIYNANMFLKDDRGYNTRFLINERQNDLLRARLKGEAFALRAWFQWDLLKKFGGRGTNGELLGFPILTEPVNVANMTPEEINSQLNFSRDTYEDCVRRIIADCDSAYKYLPIAHRDFLVPSTEDRLVLGAQNWGRLDGISTVAIKALVYLTWASPRFNETGDPSRWELAARFAKEVIDFKMTVDNVTNGFTVRRAVNWFDPNNPCIIFASRPKTGNDDMERAFYPGGFQGNGVLGATQELVDAFGMADGYPIGQSPTYPYDPANPYENRDARFYSVIFYNNRTINAGNPTTPYIFENWPEGKDAAGKNSRNSVTNYHIKKFVYSGVNWSNTTISRMPHAKFHIRWADLVLAFAEAANQYAGPNTPVHGLTAKEAIGYLR
ncbi:MAG: RagB/SusD family nutrient uptake outer membrane protein, partial [Odoribacteraceae bacterium]|nr:RagB/SusD family nutrient uptake outer membrane protein [Odoribacteraceae bacterium]